ncbi:MAG: aspartyl/glutamyl-tRNA amidotransferase subunit A, partial [Candidatus Sumerlaeia bacterium]|nr:aspartyl/glutamyl-tRNA amidotransferase subunit A [Candidatus Sumerlaeia bacterium]
RQPAGFCGVVGLKPTYGRVSRYGLVAYASSLDQIGPFAHTVEDAALVLDVIAGHDPLDSTSSAEPAPACAPGVREGSLKGLRIGRPVEFFEVEGVDPEVSAAMAATLERLVGEGAEIVDIRMPHAEEYCVATYYVLATAEASSNLARYDGAHYGFRAPDTADIVEMFSRSRALGFGPEVKRRIMLGTFVLSAETFDAYYLRALKARTLIQRDYRQALERVDVIAAPTAPTPAFPLGSKLEDPVQMYLADIFTLSLNLAGYCGIALPAGRTREGLPIGIQIMAGPFDEPRLLRAAWAIEQAIGTTA